MAAYLPVLGSSEAGKYGDVETGEALYPGIDRTENVLRLGFIRKVFGIVSCQLALTALVAGVLMLNPSTQRFFASSVWIQIALLLVSMLGLIPLYIYKDRHPINLVLLGAWTGAFSITVGVACSMVAPALVLEALGITAGVVAGLTAYTFWATKRGQDFSYMGGFLFAGLWTLVLWGLVQLFFHPGPVVQTVYALLGALLFCGYIVFDVHLLATRLPLDDYIWASVNLYLDVVNLFMYILRLLQQAQGNN